MCAENSSFTYVYCIKKVSKGDRALSVPLKNSYYLQGVKLECYTISFFSLGDPLSSKYDKMASQSPLFKVLL